MKRPAESLIGASTNLVLLGLVHLAQAFHVGCCTLGSPAHVTAVLIIPVVLVWTLIRATRDLINPASRIKAVIALVLSIPVGFFVATLVQARY